ncbi:MAG TPA: methyltransferase domain-containing protein [Bryobacteraceae bacterium]|nr:methyltransferase domain-containing protein [Bryobacteraceae bacterium]
MAALDTQVAEDYQRDVAEFARRTRELGLDGLDGYYWYHTMDLPHGLVTPGQYDFRRSLPCFPFPSDMRGMRVLDVGSATGYFAFEFERRGAAVVSVELPSLYSLDRFPGQDVEHSIARIQKMMGGADRPDAAQLYLRLLEGPFQFCHKLLSSRVERCYSTVYDLSSANTGGRPFDLVFMGDILLHTLHPLQALAAVAPLCRGELIIAQVMPESADGRPAMHYVGGDSLESDEVSWWWPNQACLEQLLRKLGFRQVAAAGSHAGLLRPSGYPFERAILRALK